MKPAIISLIILLITSLLIIGCKVKEEKPETPEIEEAPDTGAIEEIPVDTSDIVKETSPDPLDVPEDIIGENPDLGSVSDISADTSDIV